MSPSNSPCPNESSASRTLVFEMPEWITAKPKVGVVPINVGKSLRPVSAVGPDHDVVVESGGVIGVEHLLRASCDRNVIGRLVCIRFDRYVLNLTKNAVLVCPSNRVGVDKPSGDFPRSRRNGVAVKRIRLTLGNDSISSAHVSAEL